MAETNVGTLAAKLTLHTSGFSSGIDSAEKSLKGFSGSIKNIAIGTAVGSAVVSGIKTVTNSVINFGKSSFNAVADAQQLEASLKSLVTTEMVKASNGTLSYADASGQAAKKTGELTDYIRNLSILSPFSNDVVSKAFQFNASMGQSITTAKKTTEALLNLGAGLSLSQEEFTGLSVAMGQVGSTGKITQQDLRQFANNRFGLDKLNDVFVKMSDATGVVIKNTDDFNAAMESGKVTADDFYGALSRYAAENYSGSVKEMSGTFRGMSSTLKDIGYWAKVDLFKPLGDSFARAFSPVLEWLAKTLGDGGFKKIGDKIATWFKPAVDVVGQFGKDLNELGWTDALQNLKTNILNLFPEDTQKNITKFGKALKGIKDEVVPVGKAIGQWVLDNPELAGTLGKVGVALLLLKTPIGIITSLIGGGGLLGKIALLAGAFLIVKSAWDNDFLGIKTAVTNFLSETKAAFENDGISGVIKAWGEKISESLKGVKLSFDTPSVDTSDPAFADWVQGDPIQSEVIKKSTKQSDFTIYQPYVKFVPTSVVIDKNGLQDQLDVAKLDELKYGAVMDIRPKDDDLWTTKLWNKVQSSVKTYFQGVPGGFDMGTTEVQSKYIDVAPVTNKIQNNLSTGLQKVKDIEVPSPNTEPWVKTFSPEGTILKSVGSVVGGINTEFSKLNNGETTASIDTFNQTITGKFNWLSDQLVGHSIVPDMMQAIHNSVKGWLTTTNDTVKILLQQMETSFQATATNISMILASITGGGVEAPAVETGNAQPAAGTQPAAAGATGGFSALTTAITNFKTQLDLLNISLVYTVALLGNVSGISFYLTSIATYLSGTMTTTLQDFQAYLDGDFTGCLTAFNELIYLGGNSIYNSLGAIFGVLSDIYEKMAFVVERINGDLTNAFRNIVEPAGIFQGAIEAAATKCSGLASDANAAAIAIWNLIAAMEALNSGNYYRAAPGQGTSDRWKADGGSVKAGTSYVVGEQGPEVFTPRRSGWIIPNDEVFGERSSKGDLIINMNGNNYGESYIKDIVRSEVKQAVNEAVFLGNA